MYTNCTLPWRYAADAEGHQSTKYGLDTTTDDQQPARQFVYVTVDPASSRIFKLCHYVHVPPQHIA